MDFYEQAAEYLQHLETNLKHCNKSLAKSPEGSLVVHDKDGRFEYYYYANKKQKYLSEEQNELINKLAEKTYLKHFKKYANNEIEALKAYLAVRNPKISTPAKYLIDHPGISKKVASKIYKTKIDIREWADLPYDQSNAPHKENLTVPTAQGHYVRSKSEGIIANALFTSKVPYRYESTIFIDGVAYHPDFEIFTASGKHIIWEHLGKLDNKEYVRQNMKKIEAYIKAGFIPGVTLIFTSDEKEGTIIDSQIVYNLIKLYLL